MKTKYANTEEKQAAKRAYARKYREANLEKLREYERTRRASERAANPEKFNARQRKYVAANLEKVRERMRAYQAANSEKLREYRLQRYYGLTPEDYQQLLDLQGGGCALCHRLVKLCVDHDHETGRVRGLLCTVCNTALGMYEKHQRPARLILEPYEIYLTPIITPLKE